MFTIYCRWSKSSYTVHTDVLLIPTGKRAKDRGSEGDGYKCVDDNMNGRSECQKLLVGGKATIKSTATVTEHASTSTSRHRRYIGGGSRRITSKVTVLPSPSANDSSNLYCPSCSTKGGGCGGDISKNYCSRCQKHSRCHSRRLSNLKL